MEKNTDRFACGHPCCIRYQVTCECPVFCQCDDGIGGGGEWKPDKKDLEDWS